MIDRSHALPLTRQAEILKLSRSSLYYQPRPVSPADLGIMRRIGELHLDHPFAGSRMLRDLLGGEGVEIGRQRVATMMRRMGIEAIYRRPNTSKATPGNKIHPYLLRGLVIDRPDRVWAMDITYIPMARGFVYLAAVIDWFSRRVLAWRVSIDMAVDFCLEAVEEAIARHGTPDIFNTDQGSQFTSPAFTGLLADNGIAISMDGRGAWRDNVFVERLWRSVKYEEVYLRAYDSVGQARASLGRYLEFYNSKRPHSSLDARTPARPIAPISTASGCWLGRHEFLPPLSGRHSVRATPSLRDDLTTAKPTGGDSTYRTPIPVQTNPATSNPDVLRHLNGYKGELELKNRIENAVPYEKFVHYGNPAGDQGPDVLTIGPDNRFMEWDSKSRMANRRVSASMVSAASLKPEVVADYVWNAIRSHAVTPDIGNRAMEELNAGNYNICTVGTGKAFDGYFETVRNSIPTGPRR